MSGVLPWETDEGRAAVLTQYDFDCTHSEYLWNDEAEEQELRCMAKARYADHPSWIAPHAPSPVFADFVAYARALKFEQRPDYLLWRSHLRRAFAELGYADWRLKPGLDAAEIAAALASDPAKVVADNPFEPAPAGDGWSLGAFEWMSPL